MEEQNIGAPTTIPAFRAQRQEGKLDLAWST